MSNIMAWMAAEAEEGNLGTGAGFGRQRRPKDERLSTQELAEDRLGEHSFPSHKSVALEMPMAIEAMHATSWEPETREEEDRERERRTYRGRTVAMLKRYMRYSIETGRLPSLLGREFFRVKVTSYRVASFEDRVIFVHDMEKCLDHLDEFSRQLIARHRWQDSLREVGTK